MRRALSAPALFLLAFGLTAFVSRQPTTAGEDSGWTQLFNGKDLTGGVSFGPFSRIHIDSDPSHPAGQRLSR